MQNNFMEKLKLMAKDLSLFLSAFVPMFVLIFLRLVIDMMNNNLSFNVLNTLNFITLLLLIGCGCAGLLWNFKCVCDKKEITIISKQNITDKHFLGYFSLFVLFALQLDLSLVSGYILFVIIMVFIGIVYIKNGPFYINPLLNILGYNFYDVSFDDGKNKREIKLFFRGELNVGQKYVVNIKNDNFSFVDKKEEPKN